LDGWIAVKERLVTHPHPKPPHLTRPAQNPFHPKPKPQTIKNEPRCDTIRFAPTDAPNAATSAEL